MPSRIQRLRQSVSCLQPLPPRSSAQQESQTSLQSELQRDLLRGVPLDLCLRGFGAPLRAEVRGSISRDSYNLSKPTDRIDAFLSHDWKTSRASKTCALLIVFNSIPAAIAAVAVSTASCALLMLEMFPGGWLLASMLTYLCFFTVLFFWQRMRRLLRRRAAIVFLDRCCISQQDAELKRQGIQGLAGFVTISRKLIVLWSPRYFTRLWCTFELSCFLKDMDEQKHVEFVPVAMALLLWSTSTFLIGLWCLWQAFLYVVHDNRAFGNMARGFEIAVVVVFLLLALLFALPAQLYFGIEHMRELLKLQQQMAEFNIRQSECSCCSLDHTDPDTGQEMLCDRRLVFATLARWYSTPGDPRRSYSVVEAPGQLPGDSSLMSLPKAAWAACRYQGVPTSP